MNAPYREPCSEHTMRCETCGESLAGNALQTVALAKYPPPFWRRDGFQFPAVMMAIVLTFALVVTCIWEIGTRQEMRERNARNSGPCQTLFLRVESPSIPVTCRPDQEPYLRGDVVECTCRGTK